MWSEACALVDQAERMHRRFFRLLASPAPLPAWEPPVNVYASGGLLSIIVALPGAEADGVSVHVTPDGLLIEAQVRPPLLTERDEVVRLEVPYGHMRRIIALPAGRYQLVERRLSNGCLHLQLAVEGQ
jgi:HSP20 family molecular chaperone IbpA